MAEGGGWPREADGRGERVADGREGLVTEGADGRGIGWGDNVCTAVGPTPRKGGLAAVML